MAKKNYMSLSNKEIEEYIKKYDLNREDYIAPTTGSFNRKKLANILKLIDIQKGDFDKPQVVDVKGQVKDHDPTNKLGKNFSGIMAEVTFYNVDENDLPYVQLALNGMALILPREKKVWIPKEFIVGVLQNAVVTKMKMEVDNTGRINYIPKKIPRFQHTIHRIMHIDEVAKEFDELKKESENKE